MTDKNYKIYKAIVDYFKEYGFAPSVRELAERTNYSSTNVYQHLKQIEKEGWIEITFKSARAIKVVGYKFVEE